MPGQVHRRYVFIVAMLACMSASASDCVSAKHATVAVDLYRHHRDFIYNGEDSTPLSASLRKLVRANISQNLNTGDVGAVDWDFWSDAQDGELGADATVVLVSQGQGKAVVRLRYQFALSPEQPSQLRVTDVLLVQNGGGCWLVDDLQHRKQSLRALLQRGTRRVSPQSDG